MSKSCTTIDLEAFDQTKAAVAADPTAGQGSFKSTTVWEDGARARTTARTFSLETDEPAPLGGTDQNIDPMELLLAAVGTCLTIGWVTNAARRGIEFRDLKIEVEGDYDLQGYLGIDENVRPGFTSVSYTVTVDTDADPEVLEEIRAEAQVGSPMLDNVADATPLTGVVEAVTSQPA
jgi:putative redox protein